MKFIAILAPAVLAAAAIAQDTPAPPAADTPPPAAAGNRFGRPDGAGFRRGGQEGRQPGGLRAMGGLGAQAFLERIIDDPEAIAKTGIAAPVLADIKNTFTNCNAKISALQTAIAAQQDAQAKLVANKGSTEDEVAAAVDTLWKTRAEVAKLQAFKILKINKSLSADEQRKIVDVATAAFRNRRTPNAPGGAPARDGRRPMRPGRNGAAPAPAAE